MGGAGDRWRHQLGSPQYNNRGHIVKHFLGIDSGKTKIELLLVDETGLVLGWHRQERDSEKCEEGDWFSGLLDSVLGVGLPEQLTVGTCGWGYYSFYQLLRKRLDEPCAEDVQTDMRRHHEQLRVRNVTEADAIYAAAGQTYGIAILAGTGSFVEGRTRSGAVLHLGGLGPILGDEGSGFDIGLRALQLSFRNWWKGPEWSTLPDAIAATLGLDNLGQGIRDMDLICQLWHFDSLRRSEIAALAWVVNEQARAGDNLSMEILSVVAESLAEVAANVISELGMGDDNYLVIGAGGVIQGSDDYWNMLCAKIRHLMPNYLPARAPVSLVGGVILHRMQRAGLEVTSEIRKNIKEGLHKYEGGQCDEKQEATYSI